MTPDLSGVIPLFPLPAIFFPGTVLPLHIFEPRYRRMTEDLMEGDGLLAMAYLDEGWQDEYFGAPPIHRIVTVGRVRRCERLEDGRFNLELVGLARAEVLAEVSGKPYRRGRLRAVIEAAVSPEEARDLAQRLLRGLRLLVGEPQDEGPTIMLDPSLSLSGFCDRLSSVIPLETYEKMDLLAEADPAARCRALLRHLEELRRRGVLRRPVHRLPGFSAN